MQNSELFKEVMARLPTGVTVVTGAGRTGTPVGFTANAVASVSLDPHLVLVCADRGSASLSVLLESRTFGVSVLREDSEGIAHRFSENSRDRRFEDLELMPTGIGAPVLRGALAWMGCRIWKEVEAGDHVILIGEVAAAGLNAESRPLVFFRRRYGTVAEIRES